MTWLANAPESTRMGQQGVCVTPGGPKEPPSTLNRLPRTSCNADSSHFEATSSIYRAAASPERIFIPGLDYNVENLI